MKGETTNKRREFFKTAIAFSAAAAFAPQLLSAAPKEEMNLKGRDGFTFLFQGDSITDGNRTRNTDGTM